MRRRKYPRAGQCRTRRPKPAAEYAGSPCLHHMEQRYADDCAVTCLAMAAGCEHRQAIEAVHGSYSTRYAACPDMIIAGARKLGYDAAMTRNPTGRWPTLLFFDWEQEVDGDCFGWHTVVWDPGRRVLRDPNSELSSVELVEENTIMQLWRLSGKLAVAVRRTVRRLRL